MDAPSDQPPSPQGFFRSWRRLYAAVLLTALSVYVLLFVFSRIFAP
ncbi:MAG: hypothetical protein OYL41_11420 [Acidobacteriota bacterium]|nr:hypothetical protein [Acidobacteriota bacterium]